MVTHVDHTKRDVQIIVTEQGWADLRGLAPVQRVRLIIEKGVHPNYQAEMTDYLERALHDAPGKHTPHLLGHTYVWHQRYLQAGSMKAAA